MTINSWLWDFGDGQTSNLQNPTHQFGTPGTYTVKLTVTNAVGSHTKTVTSAVTVNDVVVVTPPSVTTSTQGFNLRNFLISSGWDQVSPVQATVTVAPNTWVWSDDVNVPAFDARGPFPPGSSLHLVNQGFIAGRGGNGGGGTYPSAIVPAGYLYTPAQNGGPAIALGLPATIDNTYPNAYIGGGGGGGGGDIASLPKQSTGGGGGAGGGRGGFSVSSGLTVVNGGLGGPLGSPGSIGDTASGLIGGYGGGAGGAGGREYAYNSKTVYCSGGGGGGRVFPGIGGASNPTSDLNINLPGGSANNPAVIQPYTGSAYSAGGGGGWGAAGGHYSGASVGYYGALGGPAISLNGYSVTWVSGDTARVYGAVS